MSVCCKPERQDLATLICKIIDELGVLTILPHQRLSQLKDRGVYANRPMALEHSRDLVEGNLPDSHLLWAEVSGPLGCFWLTIGLIRLYKGPKVCQNWAQLTPQRAQ